MTTYVNNFYIIAEDSAKADWLIDIFINKLKIKNLKKSLKYLNKKIEYYFDDIIKLILRYYINYLIQNFYLNNAVSIFILIFEKLKIDNISASE